MEYILPRGYLSASSIKMLLRCPKQFEFRYINGIVVPPNAALLTGTAMHRALETYYKEVMAENSMRFTADQTADMAAQYMADLVQDESDAVITDVELDASINSLKNIAHTYVDNVARYIEPLGVEEEVHYKTGDGVELLAYLDLRRKLNPETSGSGQSEGICDYKITGKKWTLNNLTNSLQFNLYSMITGIRDVEVHNMIKNTVPKRLNKKPEQDGIRDIASNIRLVHHVFSPDVKDHMENLVEQCARLITSGIFTPCDTESWCCNSDWCGYWNWCRGRTGGKSLYVDMAG